MIYCYGFISNFLVASCCCWLFNDRVTYRRISITRESGLRFVAGNKSHSTKRDALDPPPPHCLLPSTAYCRINRLLAARRETELEKKQQQHFFIKSNWKPPTALVVKIPNLLIFQGRKVAKFLFISPLFSALVSSGGMIVRNADQPTDGWNFIIEQKGLSSFSVNRQRRRARVAIWLTITAAAAAPRYVVPKKRDTSQGGVRRCNVWKGRNSCCCCNAHCGKLDHKTDCSPTVLLFRSGLGRRSYEDQLVAL